VEPEPSSPGQGRHLEHPTSRVWSWFDGVTSQKSILPIVCGVPPQLTDDVILVAAARSRPGGSICAMPPSTVWLGTSHGATGTST